MNKEIEVRFKDIDKEGLIKKLTELGAENKGEIKLHEVIFYDSELTWQKQSRFVRLRKAGEHIELTYKRSLTAGKEISEIDDMIDISIKIDNIENAKQILEAVGLVAKREQEKYRHTFMLNNVTIDIDTWPQIPTYVEIEGESAEAVQDAATLLGFDWKDAFFKTASDLIATYGVDILSLEKFTFEEVG